MLKRCLEGIISGVSYRNVVAIASERGSERIARAVDNGPIGAGIDAVLSHWAAGRSAGCNLAWLAHTQAKRRIAGVCFEVTQKGVSLRSDVRETDEAPRLDLTLNRKAVLFRVRKPVLIVKTRRAGDWKK